MWANAIGYVGQLLNFGAQKSGNKYLNSELEMEQAKEEARTFEKEGIEKYLNNKKIERYILIIGIVIVFALLIYKKSK